MYRGNAVRCTTYLQLDSLFRLLSCVSISQWQSTKGDHNELYTLVYIDFSKDTMLAVSRLSIGFFNLSNKGEHNELYKWYLMIHIEICKDTVLCCLTAGEHNELYKDI